MNTAEYKKVQARHGRKGGKTTFKLHGKEHMKKISKKGIAAIRKAKKLKDSKQK